MTRILTRLTPLHAILSLHGFGQTNFFPSATSTLTTFHTKLFGAPRDLSSNTVSEQTTEVVVFMLKHALGSEPFDWRASVIWRSALFRTSSRPVDMVFSIMGLFGVTLDTRRFGKDDRLDATIALMQEILRHSGRASWLGLAPYLPVNPMLSTIPVFPRTHIEGQVLVEVDAWRADEQERRLQRTAAILDVRAISMPMGSMDDAGYLTLLRKAIRIYPQLDLQAFHKDDEHLRPDSRIVSPSQCCLNLRAINHTGWRFYEGPHDGLDESSSPRTFAVLLGWYNEFSQQGFWNGPRHLGTLLIKEHAPNKFHVESYFELSSRLEFWVETWKEYTLHIGGPLKAAHPDGIDIKF